MCGRIDELVRQRQGGRVIVGVVGLPGSGKTTLAEALVAALLEWHAEWTDHRTDRVSDPTRPWIGSHVAHVPMDGFHLADVELNRLGRADRKGAPDTFDAAGYAALLERLRRADGRRVGAGLRPDRRTADRRAASRCCATPGWSSPRATTSCCNDPVWANARSHLDTVWFYDLEDDVRRQRLIDRHIRFGKSRRPRWPGSTAPINGTPN